MTTGLQMFLLAAQELNFTRAAQKAFVTPQCLSDHIERLEEQYQVTLFQRRPRLQLTAEGETMVRYLTRIQALEDSMSNELADISGGVRGSIRLGMPTTRGITIVPRVVPQFQQQFPNVDVQIYLNDTRTLERLLLDGELDLFLGVDANQHPLFHKELVGQEPLYLVISQRSMRMCYPNDWRERTRRFLRQGADLSLLQNAPLIQGHSSSTTTDLVQKFLLQHNIDTQFPIRVSDFDALVELCRTGRYMTICARAQLHRLIQSDQENMGEDFVYAFRVRGWDRRMDVELVTHRDSRPLKYMEQFQQMLCAAVQAEDQAILQWLERVQSRENAL